jgi:adenosylhomocysteine nucleosidase
MKIAILAPMRSELAPVVQAFGLQKCEGPGGVTHSGAVDGADIVTAMTGIGMAGAKRATEQLLDAGSIDHVMVVGIAGGVGTSVKIGDLIYPDVVVDKSTGAEYRPTHLGAPEARGTIVSSDEFLVDPNQLTGLIADGVIGLDMETGAVAAVAEARGCPWSVIRGISDMATDHPDASVLALAKPDGSANGPAVAKFLLTKPWRIPHLAKLQRDSKFAATAAARAAVHACSSQ